MADHQHGTDSRPQIPDRLFFRIGEVTEIAGVEAHVLRFWESEFSMLSPRKTPSGQRQYRRKDVETILTIKQLLYERKYTIAGARQALRERGAVAGQAAPEAAEAATPLFDASSPLAGDAGSRAAVRQGLAGIRSGLEQILRLLET